MKSIRLAGKLIFAGALLCATASSTFATSYTWPTASGSGYWTNSTKWTPSGVPGSGDTATVSPFQNVNFSIILDGGNRSLNDLLMQGSGSYSTDNSLIINLNSGASLTTPFTTKLGGGIIVSNGTLIGTGDNGLGASGTGGRLTVDGGSVYITNGASFSVRQGSGLDSILQVNAGTFTYNDNTVGFSFAVGETTTSGGHSGRGIMNVAGGTVNVSGAADQMKIGNWTTSGIATGIVNVTSGTMNTFLGSLNKRIAVGSRAPGFGASPDSAFANHLAQLNVSGGTLNADGWGVFVGRSGDSPGEFNIFSGEANVGGMILGASGKLVQTNGVLNFTARHEWITEVTDSAQHLFMSGGLTRFVGVYSNKMTINMGGAAAGNLLGQGFYNVEFGGDSMSPFQITLPNEFFGRGTASGGNGILRDGIMDLGIWTNVTVVYNATSYSGTNGPTSLYTFASLAQTWGWDAFVIVPEPTVSCIFALSSLLMWRARRRR